MFDPAMRKGMGKGRWSPFNFITDIIDHPDVEPEPNSGCWLWKGNRTRAGYGHVRFAGKHVIVTRLALKLRGIEVPSDMIVCHKCDTPPCVNPDHLYVGTYADNMRDAKAKLDLRFDGEKHWNAKLTEKDVIEIRALPKPIDWALQSSRYGVSQDCIKDVVYRASWRHI